MFRLDWQVWCLSEYPKLGTTNERGEAATKLEVGLRRPETCGVTDCLDELMGENVGFDRDLLSRSICACLSEISPEVPDWAGMEHGEPGSAHY